ncbi:MAG: hypothetical protein ACREQ7_17125 [Candidatus Binatia bacterium]
MSKIRVMFHKCSEAGQEQGNNDQHMVSRLYFSLEIRGQRYDGLYAEVKQTGEPSHAGHIEVSSPQGAAYTGPFNYEIYRYAAENYYWNIIRRHRIPSRAGTRIRNNEVICPAVVEFDASGPDVSW